MKTKDRILAAALKLYNEQGIEPITVRHIAKELGMSHGNLCYHFPTTDHIIHALYLNLVNEISTAFEQLTHTELSLKRFSEALLAVMRLFQQYRFFLIDFVAICRRVSVIKQHYLALIKQREETELHFLRLLQQNGIIQADIPDSQLLFLVQRVAILADFWLSNAEILSEPNETKKLSRYHQLIFSDIWPYLSKEGRADYDTLFPTSEIS